MLENFFRRVTDLGLGIAEPPAVGELVAVDGDNVRWQGKNCRLVGFDAPEIRSKHPLEKERAFRAMLRLQERISIASRLEVRPYHAGKDRWDRPLVQLFVDGRDIADIAIEEGWARRYEKGRKPAWHKPSEHFSIPERS